jgi:hypothetical protein
MGNWGNYCVIKEFYTRVAGEVMIQIPNFNTKDTAR